MHIAQLISRRFPRHHQFIIRVLIGGSVILLGIGALLLTIN